MSSNHEKDLIGGEIESGAWSRFERAVDAAVKSGPQHKKAAAQKAASGSADKKTRPASKGRAHKKKARPDYL